MPPTTLQAATRSRCDPELERADRRSACGAKRKPFAILSFSGFDPVVGPKADIRSPEQLVAVHIPLSPFQDPDRCDTMRCVVLTPGGDYETPGVHHAARWCGGMAVRGACAAAGNAGDRISAPHIARSLRGESARISPGPQGDRIRRRRERCVRISLG